MFKRSRRKIVAAIMSVLVLLWVGTLGVIYGSSFFEMKERNRQLLRTHAQMYVLSGSISGLPSGRPQPDVNHGFKPDFDPESPRFQLSTFYSVAVSYDGNILAVKNDPPTVHTNEDLTGLAKQIIRSGKETGTENNLAFYKSDKGGYLLVTFMDNTVMNEGAVTLFRYTLIFGGVALVVFFILSVFLARKIVAPLEESYQKQKQFISDAGHELKTPVSVVSANAELLSRQLGENQWLANIQYENERMGRLVGQLLDLARTETMQYQTERIDLSRLVASEVLPFESVAFEKGMALQSSIAPGIAIDGNSTQLKQLVSILLDNGIEHGQPENAVCLHLSCEHAIAELCVINKGDEIPLQQRQQLFERFYRVDTVRNGKDKHYGLGLAIAKAIVDAHHGQIEVLCYNGLVEFRVQLPVVKERLQ